MDCFDHSKPQNSQCNWCGRAMCQMCVGRTDGKKMYCHNCSEKLPKAKPQSVASRVETHFASKNIEIEEEHELQIKPIKTALHTNPVVNHKSIDPRHFELDDDFEDAGARPIQRKAVIESKPSILGFKPRTEGKPAVSSHPVSSSASTTPAHTASASSALGMFAKSAMETKAKPSSQLHSSNGTSEHSVHQTSSPGIHSAASSALGMFATQAMETKNKPSSPSRPISSPSSNVRPTQTIPAHSSSSESISAHSSTTSAATSALGMFAAQAMETKNKHVEHKPQPTQQEPPIHEDEQMEPIPNPKDKDTIHGLISHSEESTIEKNEHTSAASSAINMIAEQAKETAKKVEEKKTE